VIKISCVNLRKGYKRQAQGRTQSLKSELVQKNESAKFFYLHSIAEYHTSVVPQISKTKFSLALRNLVSFCSKNSLLKMKRFEINKLIRYETFFQQSVKMSHFDIVKAKESRLSII
jgi:hypothetical protein